MAANYDRDLLEGLEAIFKHLEKKHLVTNSMKENKKGILESLAETLTASKMNPRDLKDPVVQMRTMGAIMSKGLGFNNLEKKFTTALSGKNRKGKLTELDKSLLLVMTALKLKLKDKDFNLKPKQFADHLLDAYKQLVLKWHGGKKELDEAELTKTLSDAKTLKRDTPLQKSLEEIFDEQIHGGVNQLGEIPNLAVLTCFNLCLPLGRRELQVDPSSSSYVAREAAYNSDQEDYLGGEALMKTDDLAKGILDTLEIDPSPKSELNNDLEKIPAIRGPMTLSPNMPGKGGLPR